jgi:hypothetical protein
LKEVVSKEPNPKWTDQTAAGSDGSSGSAATTTDGTVKVTPQLDVMAPPQWIYKTTFDLEEVVKTFNPSLDRADRSRNVPYTLLNQQCINMFVRLLNRSLHYLLIYNETINPHDAATSVFKNIKQHFSCSAWMNKDSLNQKWEAIRVCSDPEEAYNELLALNQECLEAGSGYTEFQVASKFVYLLQNNHIA